VARAALGFASADPVRDNVRLVGLAAVAVVATDLVSRAGRGLP
jgi:hypothetical protein